MAINFVNTVEYVEKEWLSKGVTVQVKKLTQADFNKISAPLLRRSPTSVPVMDICSEMQKMFVEIGLSAYKENGRSVIDRAFVDQMAEQDFRDVFDLVQEVNPLFESFYVYQEPETSVWLDEINNPVI